MSEYYAKLAGDPTYWHVKDGMRRAVSGIKEMYGIGLLELRIVSADVLDAIPIAGAKVKKAQRESKEE